MKLYYSDCTGQQKIDRYCHLTGTQPAEIYQKVFGQAPTQQQLDAYVQAPAPQGQQSFIDMNPIDAENFLRNSPQGAQQTAQTAQTNYQQGIGSAVSTLQGAGNSLDTQYKTLLSAVLGQGSVAMNTATTGENNLLASRGITNNSPLYSQQMTQAQLPVTAQNQAAVGNLGYTEGQLQTGLAGNIAGIQAGGAGTAAGLPLQYGSLALSQAANIANIGLAGAQAKAAGAQARYIPIPGVGLWDTQTGQFTGGQTNNNFNSGGFQVLSVK